jgi:hypothetical protein
MTEPTPDPPRKERLRDRLKAEMADESSPRPVRARKVARLRAKAVKDAFAERKKKNPIRIGHIDIGHIEDTDGAVEIWFGKHEGPPDWRINNPPTLVKDPTGEVDLGERGRYREDPLAAVAEAIETHRRRSTKGLRR